MAIGPLGTLIIMAAAPPLPAALPTGAGAPLGMINPGVGLLALITGLAALTGAAVPADGAGCLLPLREAAGALAEQATSRPLTSQEHQGRRARIR